MTHKIIQWNCCGYKANYNELLLLISELNLTTICLKETFKNFFKKAVTSQIRKIMNSMTGLRASGGVSILIRKNVPKVKSTLVCKQLQSQQFYTKLLPFAHYISNLMIP